MGKKVTFGEGGKGGGKFPPLHLVYFITVIHREP